MLLKIANILTREQVDMVKGALANARFVEGKLTAGKAAAPVKNNEQADNSVEGMRRLSDLVIGNLCQHETFRLAALPAGVAPAVFARYGPGMSYGYHVDEAVGTDNQNRADIAVTIFLSDARDYEGGELAIQTNFGEQEVKLPAGDAVIYPASSLHRVREVRSGQRLVAVSWVQSLVRDPARRELLYELGEARELSLASGVDERLISRLQRVYANLLRMWAEV